MTEETISYFKTIPLCASRLALPNVKIHKYIQTPEDPFFRKVARTYDGVHRSLFFYRNEQKSLNQLAEGHLFVQVGKDVSGQLNIAHGGFLATIMDEVSGNLIGTTRLDEGLGMFTVALNTTYQRPFFVPGVIVARSRVMKVEGRKVFIEATISDQEGNVCTTAEVIFVKKRPATV